MAEGRRRSRVKMDYFPYEYRPGQKELVSFIDRTVRDSRCAVIEAGTGTGKTITSLCGVLGYEYDFLDTILNQGFGFGNKFLDGARNVAAMD